MRGVNTRFSRCTEARGQRWLSCLSPFALLMWLFWDNKCWAWYMWTWLDWLASKLQGLAFLSLSRTRMTGTGHRKPGVCWGSEHGSPRVQWTLSNPSSPSFSVELRHFIRILSILPRQEWNTGTLKNPVSLQYLSRNDFNKSLIGLLWNLSPNQCIRNKRSYACLSLLKLPWLHKNQFYVRW